MEERRRGFTYSVSREQIDEYRLWPIERRLQWLFLANKMGKALPRKRLKFRRPSVKARSNKSFSYSMT
jgi:hypothetical protein